MRFEEVLPLLREGKVLRRKFWPTRQDHIKNNFNETVDKFIEIRVRDVHGSPQMLAQVYFSDSKTEPFKNCWVYGLCTRDLMADDWEVVEK